ncbi:hypothetical protein JOF58_007681 [Streptomyces cinnamonensis]|nr:hypothetical protein [Streptomyces virginiae]
MHESRTPVRRIPQNGCYLIDSSRCVRWARRAPSGAPERVNPGVRLAGRVGVAVSKCQGHARAECVHPEVDSDGYVPMGRIDGAGIDVARILTDAHRVGAGWTRPSPRPPPTPPARRRPGPRPQRPPIRFQPVRGAWPSRAPGRDDGPGPRAGVVADLRLGRVWARPVARSALGAGTTAQGRRLIILSANPCTYPCWVNFTSWRTWAHLLWLRPRPGWAPRSSAKRIFCRNVTLVPPRCFRTKTQCTEHCKRRGVGRGSDVVDDDRGGGDLVARALCKAGVQGGPGQG